MDYNINFPHLHIYLDHVGKNIMIGNFSIAYYGIVIAIGMLALHAGWQSVPDKVPIHTLIWHWWLSYAL